MWFVIVCFLAAAVNDAVMPYRSMALHDLDKIGMLGSAFIATVCFVNDKGDYDWLITVTVISMWVYQCFTLLRVLVRFYLINAVANLDTIPGSSKMYKRKWNGGILKILRLVCPADVNAMTSSSNRSQSMDSLEVDGLVSSGEASQIPG